MTGGSDWREMTGGSERSPVLHTDINSNHKFEYYLHENIIKVADHEKDLGVLSSDTLLWTALVYLGLIN